MKFNILNRPVSNSKEELELVTRNVTSFCVTRFSNSIFELENSKPPFILLFLMLLYASFVQICLDHSYLLNNLVCTVYQDYFYLQLICAVFKKFRSVTRK